MELKTINEWSLEDTIKFITIILEKNDEISIYDDNNLLCLKKDKVGEKIVINKEIVPNNIIIEYRKLLHILRMYRCYNDEIEGIHNDESTTYFIKYNENIYSIKYTLSGVSISKSEFNNDISVIEFKKLNQYYNELTINTQEEKEKQKIKTQ